MRSNIPKFVGVGGLLGGGGEPRKVVGGGPKMKLMVKVYKCMVITILLQRKWVSTSWTTTLFSFQ